MTDADRRLLRLVADALEAAAELLRLRNDVALLREALERAQPYVAYCATTETRWGIGAAAEITRLALAEIDAALAKEVEG